MVGYAVTALIRAEPAPIDGHRTLESAWWDHVVASPGPRVVVMHDVDEPRGQGAYWGEVQANIHRALGCLGVVTDGTVRDLPLPEHRLPLGALLNGGYESRHTAVGPGELVVGYSDGVVEAQNPGGEQFGEERLRRILGEGPCVPQLVVRRVLDEIRAFTSGAEPYDDITLVAFARDLEARV